MSPCEEIILRTIQRMARCDGEARNNRIISGLASVSEQHTRRCRRALELAQLITNIVEPGKPVRIQIKTKGDNL